VGTGVLVTGADHPTALGVLRALQSEVVDVYGLTSLPGAAPCRSGMWKQVLSVNGSAEDAWLEALIDAGKAHGRLVLIPTQDELVGIIARNAEMLAVYYDFVIPPPDTVDLLLDKTAFHAWATPRCFPVPTSDVVGTQVQLDAVLDRARYPVLLKPFSRSKAWDSQSPLHKVYRLDKRTDIRRLPFSPFNVADRYLVQQWIEGRDSDVYFCLTYRDRKGRELAHRTGRKLVQWPVDTGSTALCTSTDDGALHRLTSDVFDAVGLVGLGSLEVKRDTRDAQYYITEPTVGRPNLQSNVATVSGVNLTAMAYRDAVGLPAEPSVAATRSALWLDEYHLPRALLFAIRAGRLDYRSLATSVRRADAVSCAYYSRQDPKPVLSQARQSISSRRSRR